MTNETPTLAPALEQLKELYEKASKKVLSDEEITKIQGNYNLIDKFIQDTENSYRNSTYDGISGSKTLKDLKISSRNMDQYAIRDESLTISSVVRSHPIKELKDRKRELNTYLKKNKENKRSDLFVKNVHDLIAIRKELEIREKSKIKVKLTVGIEPDEFYRRYDLNLLEKQEKNRLQEKIKKSYRPLLKKEKISQEEITAFHNDLCSYIDKAGLRSPNSFYDMRTSKTATQKGINVINTVRRADAGILSISLPKLTDSKLKKGKKALNGLLKKSLNDVGNPSFNARLNEIAVYKEEFDIRKRLSKLDKMLGINARKIYTKPTSSELEKNVHEEKWNELRDKFRPLDSPHLKKDEKPSIENRVDEVEQRTEAVDLNAVPEPDYATIGPRDEHQSDNASRVSLESSVPDTPIASSSERTHAKAPASAASIPTPPPMPERPIEAINTTALKKEPPSELSQNGAHSDKKTPATEHQTAAVKSQNLGNPNQGKMMNELKAVLAKKQQKNQSEENKYSQIIQDNQITDQKNSMAALMASQSKRGPIPPPPPPRNREKQQSVETLKALVTSQSKSPVKPDSMENKITYFEQNLCFR